MQAIEQCFPVVLFIMLYKLVLTFESVDEILKWSHSNKSHWVVLSCGTVYFAVQAGSNFWVCGWNPKVTEQFLRMVVLIVVIMDKILKCYFERKLFSRLWCGWLETSFRALPKIVVSQLTCYF